MRSLAPPAPPANRGLLAVAIALLLGFSLLMPPVRARAEEQIAIQKYLAHLYLGDTLKTVERIYPPLRKWPSYMEPRGRVRRMKLQAVSADYFPNEVDVMWVGMRRDRVVEIQLIYTAEFTRETPAEELVRQLALIYGEPNMSPTRKFYWTDGRRVMRVFDKQVPVLRGKQRVVEMRACLQLLDESLLHRKDE